MSNIIQSEPGSFEEAVKHQVWKDPMYEEYDSIMKNDVWDVVPRQEEKVVVTLKWLHKIKHGSDGSAEKYKERFVARGFSKKEGIDYDDIFAPVACIPPSNILFLLLLRKVGVYIRWMRRPLFCIDL